MAKKSKKEIDDKLDYEDSLASVIAKQLNTDYKSSLGKVAYMDGEGDSPSDVNEWVSTGCDILDLAIANRPYGGFPVGRIVEIAGLEGSGKSLLAAQTCAETQKKGGLAIYIDTEAAVSTEFFQALGVDTTKNWLYLAMYELENIFETIEKIISKAREQDNKKLITIVIDSIMGATTKTESASDYDKDGWATAKSIVLSKAMRKITSLIAKERILLILTNQLRTKLGVSFGDSWTTSGGKAVPFHASVRLRLKSKGQIKIKASGPDTIAGVQTEAKVVKNRMGPPGRTVDFDIYFDSGLDNYGSWLTMMKAHNIVKQSGAYYTYTYVDTDENSGGEVQDIKFMSKDFVSKLHENPNLHQSLYGKICETYIMKYKLNEDFGSDDVEIVDDIEIDLG